MGTAISTTSDINIFYANEAYYYEINSVQTQILFFPIRITNMNVDSTVINIRLTSDLPVNIDFFYFICESPNITIDGNSYTIQIENVIDYSGFVRNGTFATDSYTNVNIKNIKMILNNSTLAESAGWIAHSYFAKGSNVECMITNCEVSGISLISDYVTGINSGGICGSYSGSTQGNLTITNCSVNSNIVGAYSGGICGPYSGSNEGNITIKNSHLIGDILSVGSGGICGGSCGSANGNITIKNSYSTGDIIGSQSGGICGLSLGENGGVCSISYSYALGNIVGTNSGGICGSSVGVITSFGYNVSNIIIDHCYTIGTIEGLYSGGICGGSASYGGGLTTVSNCYTRGNVTDIGSGGIYGSGAGLNGGNCIASNSYSFGLLANISNGIFTNDSESCTMTNCYAANGEWNNSLASTNLEAGTTPTFNSNPKLINPIGTIWADISYIIPNVIPNNRMINTIKNTVKNISVSPWIFSSFGSSPYENPTANIQSGEQTQSANIVEGIEYQIVAISKSGSAGIPSIYSSISINNTNGVINTKKNTKGGQYIIYILATNLNGSYSMSIFTLNLKQNIYPSYIHCDKIKHYICVCAHSCTNTNTNSCTNTNTKTKIKLKPSGTFYYSGYEYKIISYPKGKISKFNKHNGKFYYTPPKNFIGKTYIEYICVMDDIQVSPINKLCIDVHECTI